MTTNPPIGDDDLHAYVDGRLLPARRAEVEAWLADHPEDATRAQFYARVNAELHRHFDPVLTEPVSDAMTHPSKARGAPIWRRAAIGAACIAIGAIGGWFAHGWYDGRTIAGVTTAPSLPVQAAIAHAIYSVEKRHPVEVGIDEEAHLMRWLSNRMGREIKAPRLDAQGFRLIGGRLLPAAEGGVACQFMYERADGQRVTLFIKWTNQGPGETSFHFATAQGGVNVFYWRDDRVGYALSAGMPRDELSALARAVYEKISD